jgi:hypothetical protein
MTNEDIAALQADVGSALQEAADVFQENRFLKRVLRQAVLTHNGCLVIDPQMARFAASEAPLDISNGGVRFYVPDVCKKP